MGEKRLGWDEYFLGMLENISKRSTCRGKCSCIFVKDNRILTTGYAGSPPGFPHCDDIGHQIEERRRIIKMEPSKNMSDVEIDGVKYTYNFETERYESELKEHCVRTVHSEENAIIQAAKTGVSLNDSTLYLTMTPCRTCMMKLISVGVKRIVCLKKYHSGEESELMCRRAGIPIEFVHDEVLKYDEK